MRFLVMGRHEAENIRLIDHNTNGKFGKFRHVWISIGDPDKPDAKVRQNELCRDVLRLKFDDCDETDDSEWVPMVPNQAKEIVDFVCKHKDEIDMILVHCEAGISRSAGTAAALSIWLNDHDSGIAVGHPRYHPNTHVKSLIMREINPTEMKQGENDV